MESGASQVNFFGEVLGQIMRGVLMQVMRGVLGQIFGEVFAVGGVA